MFENLTQEEFDTLHYYDMIDSLQKEGMYFNTYNEAKKKGFEAHHIIPLCVQEKKRKDHEIDDRCVRVSEVDHAILHLKGALEFGGKWKLSSRGMFNGLDIDSIQICSCADIKRTTTAVWVTNGKESKMVPRDYKLEDGWWYGCHLKPNLGKIWINNGESLTLIQEDEEIPQGWKKGFLDAYNDTFRGTFFITNGIENKRIPNGSVIPNGWVRGMADNPKFYKHWITNGKENKKIPINEEIPKGWWIGRVSIGEPKIYIHKGKEIKCIGESEEIPNGWERGRGMKPNLGRIRVTNGEQIKMIDGKLGIPEGWHRWTFEGDGK